MLPISQLAGIISSQTSSGGSSTPYRNSRTNTQYATLAAAVAGSISGDTIKVAAGTYVINQFTDIGSPIIVRSGSVVGIELDTLTVEWETPGSPPLIDISPYALAAGPVGNDGSAFKMGPTCNNLTLRGLWIRGARYSGALSNTAVYALPGYGIGSPPPAFLTLEYCKIYEHVNGVITGYQSTSLTTTVNYCLFQDNGGGDGLSHGIYASGNLMLDILGSTFETTANSNPQPGLGHLIKSRCKTTRIRGCLFDPAYGTATDVDIPNGGAFTATGNVFFKYPATLYADENPVIKFAEEQHPNSFANYENDGRTHSIVLSQNTFRFSQGGVGNGADFTMMRVDTPVDNTNTAMTVTQIVNNNIVASNQSAAAAFVASYPNNSAVAVGTIGAYGVYSGSDIAGSPVQNDAPYAWGGELMTALARGDTFRGGRIANIPSWVPSTAWQYVDIPGTRFDDYAKVDGTGILPAAYVPNNANTGGITLVANYSSMYAFGGACYSPKNHEMWIFGGGHDATTANCVLKWRLGQNSPDIVAITQPTTLVIQNAQFGTAGYASNAYWSDGQPHVAHMYRNLQYLDTIDELIGVSLTYGSGSTLQGDAISWPDIPGLPRGSTTWRSAGYWPNISDESGYGAPADMLCFPAFDQSAVYWSHASGPLRKLDATTKTITAYGTGLDYTFKALGAARHDQTVALVVGGNYTTADWNARMVDLTTGVAIAQTVVGMAWDTNSDWRDLIWCDSLGCWIAWLASVPNNTLAYSHIVKLTITGTNQLTATEVTTTGTGHTTSGGSGGRGLYWDSQYSCLILAGWGSANLKALKVS